VLAACLREIAEVEKLERAKVEAKELAKVAAKDSNKLSMADKASLEDTLSKKHPGTPGLSGKSHTAAGRKFLQSLIKFKKDGSYELPQWEDRQVACCSRAPIPSHPLSAPTTDQDFREGGR
jgi:hypothetical protein